MSKTTTDHKEIQRWVSERGGYPARVKGTEEKGCGLLRIDYPGYSGEDTLETISWTEFFKCFEQSKLAFIYQDETKSGEESRFSKFVDRNQTNH
jgi:hypothetical protein